MASCGPRRETFCLCKGDVLLRFSDASDAFGASEEPFLFFAPETACGADIFERRWFAEDLFALRRNWRLSRMWACLHQDHHVGRLRTPCLAASGCTLNEIYYVVIPIA